MSIADTLYGLRKYHQRFYDTFNLRLVDYYDISGSFDLEKFRKDLKFPGDRSFKDWIEENYGGYGIDLIDNILIVIYGLCFWGECI